MSAVYLAQVESLGDKLVAVKEMSLSGFTSREREQAAEQFSKEATFLANLEHPNLVKVTDFFTEDGHWYLIMDYVRGESLQQKFIRRGRAYSWEELRPWAEQLLEVLSYLHNRPEPIIFRDLKPSNVMLSEDGHLSLIDFGIARTLAPGEKTNTFLQGVGTSGFSPIEQYGCGDSTDARSDIYSLGATLYYLLTGVIPPSAVERVSEGRKLLQVEEPLLKALSVRRKDRFQSVEEFAAALSVLSADGAEYEFPTEDLTKNPTRIAVELFDSKSSKSELSFWRQGLASVSLALASMAVLAMGNPSTRPLAHASIPVRASVLDQPEVEFGKATSEVAPSSVLRPEVADRPSAEESFSQVDQARAEKKVEHAEARVDSETRKTKTLKRTEVKIRLTPSVNYPKAKPRSEGRLAEIDISDGPGAAIQSGSKLASPDSKSSSKAASKTSGKQEKTNSIPIPAFGGPSSEFGQSSSGSQGAGAQSSPVLASNNSSGGGERSSSPPGYSSGPGSFPGGPVTGSGRGGGPIIGSGPGGPGGGPGAGGRGGR